MFSDIQIDLILQLQELGKNPERIQAINEKVRGIIDYGSFSRRTVRNSPMFKTTFNFT